MKKILSKYEEAIIFVVGAAFAFLIITLLSPTTSLIDRGEPPVVDSAIFQVIGKNWADGLLPYVTAWDSKGPLIFWINAVGYWLAGSAKGIFWLQLLANSIAFWLIYKTYRLGFNKTWSTVCWFLTIFAYSKLYDQGNNVGEYLLPLLAWAAYLILKWVNTDSEGMPKYHPAGYAFLYGAILAFALLTRLTNAIGICGITAVIGIHLIYRQQWQNLGANIVAFIAVFGVLLLPFVIYFASHGALYEMWYGTLLYNLEYAGSQTGSLTGLTYWSHLFVVCSSCWLLVVTGIMVMLLDRNRRWVGAMWLVAGGLSAIWLQRSHLAPHYAIVYVPYFVISLLELNRLRKTIIPEFGKMAITAIIDFELATMAVTGVFVVKCVDYFSTPDARIAIWREMISDIPEREMKTAFVGYNIYPDLYVYENIRPCLPYFALQDWEIQCGQSLKPRIRAAFSSGKAKWILIANGKTNIDDILAKQYTLVKTQSDFRLYHIKK